MEKRRQHAKAEEKKIRGGYPFTEPEAEYTLKGGRVSGGKKGQKESGKIPSRQGKRSENRTSKKKRRQPRVQEKKTRGRDLPQEMG